MLIHKKQTKSLGHCSRGRRNTGSRSRRQIDTFRTLCLLCGTGRGKQVHLLPSQPPRAPPITPKPLPALSTCLANHKPWCHLATCLPEDSVQATEVCCRIELCPHDWHLTLPDSPPNLPLCITFSHLHNNYFILSLSPSPPATAGSSCTHLSPFTVTTQSLPSDLGHPPLLTKSGCAGLLLLDALSSYSSEERAHSTQPLHCEPSLLLPCVHELSLLL